MKTAEKWIRTIAGDVREVERTSLARFACACAIRSLVNQEASDCAVDDEAWDAIASRLASLRGYASDEEWIGRGPFSNRVAWNALLFWAPEAAVFAADEAQFTALDPEGEMEWQKSELLRLLAR